MSAGAALAGGTTAEGAGAGGGAGSGPLLHAASTPRMAASSALREWRSSAGPIRFAPGPLAEGDASPGNPTMWIIVLEAIGAGLLLVLIVWWTMFSGRKRGERRPPPD